MADNEPTHIEITFQRPESSTHSATTASVEISTDDWKVVVDGDLYPKEVRFIGELTRLMKKLKDGDL